MNVPSFFHIYSILAAMFYDIPVTVRHNGMCAEPTATCRLLMETLAEWHIWIMPRYGLRHLHPAHLHTPCCGVFQPVNFAIAENALWISTWSVWCHLALWLQSGPVVHILFWSGYGCCQRRDSEMFWYLVLPIFPHLLWLFWIPAHRTRVDFCLQQAWTHLNVHQKSVHGGWCPLH